MHPLMRDRKGPVKSVNYQAPDGELALSYDDITRAAAAAEGRQIRCRHAITNYQLSVFCGNE